MPNLVNDMYGNRLRVRACGICLRGEKLLVVNHQSVVKGDFWAPPGGGVSFEEQAEACILREFKEETGLTVEVGKFLFACEFISPPLHAIELFFEVIANEGDPVTGYDPEMGSQDQIIRDVQFLGEAELKKIHPGNRHGLFKLTTNPAQILHLRGYFKL